MCNSSFCTCGESKNQTIDLTAEKPAEQVDLTNGDDKTDGDEADTKIKAEEAKPEESDSATTTKKRPREDDEGIYV